MPIQANTYFQAAAKTLAASLATIAWEMDVSAPDRLSTFFLKTSTAFSKETGCNQRAFECLVLNAIPEVLGRQTTPSSFESTATLQDFAQEQLDRLEISEDSHLRLLPQNIRRCVFG